MVTLNTMNTSIPISIVFLLLTTSLIGCTHQNLPMQGLVSPLLYDAQEIENAQSIVLFVPGALTPVHIFDPAANWINKGYALAYFRLPGLDRLPLDHNLNIDNAARQIAEFVNNYPEKPIRLVGYSTGGAIVIEATKYTQVPNLKIAALSPAVDKAGGLSTILRGARDIIGAAIRVGSVNRERVWLEYYRTLLFGRKGLKKPDLANEIDRLVKQEKNKIVFPAPKLSSSHSQDIRRWSASAIPLDPKHIAFFIGKEDPVFSEKQTKQLARTVGVTRVMEYENGGHLLFVTHLEVFDDILQFFQEQ